METKMTNTYDVISKGEVRMDVTRKSWKDTDPIFNSC